MPHRRRRPARGKCVALHAHGARRRFVCVCVCVFVCAASRGATAPTAGSASAARTTRTRACLAPSAAARVQSPKPNAAEIASQCETDCVQLARALCACVCAALARPMLVDKWYAEARADAKLRALGSCKQATLSAAPIRRRFLTPSATHA
jgi:hypothetical protein